MELDQNAIQGWLQAWGRIAQLDMEFAEPSEMRGLLNDVRWDQNKLEALFAVLPNGGAILERIRAATACQAGEDVRPYVIATPLPATDAELIELARDALTRNEALGFPKEPEAIRLIRPRPNTDENARNSAPLTEALHDLFIEEWTSEVYFLRETVYGLTTSPPVTDWILTPGYNSRIREVDPFEPLFELWKRGATGVVTWGALGEGPAVVVGD